jgi:hypothetical protein
MIDLTGVVCRPKKLSKGHFPDNTKVKAGTKFWGDGRDFRVTYCNASLEEVRKWFSGAVAARKLTRASFIEGK